MSSPVIKQVLPMTERREDIIGLVARQLRMLPKEKRWRVEVTEEKPSRSKAQNALLWSLYTDIIRLGGEAFAGIEKEELHEYFLCSHFGSHVKTIFGKQKHVPLHRSSSLNKQEFTDFVDYVVRFMAEKGVYLSLPDDPMVFGDEERAA